jgi:hypothetical protein
VILSINLQSSCSFLDSFPYLIFNLSLLLFVFFSIHLLILTLCATFLLCLVILLSSFTFFSFISRSSFLSWYIFLDWNLFFFIPLLSKFCTLQTRNLVNIVTHSKNESMFLIVFKSSLFDFILSYLSW